MVRLGSLSGWPAISPSGMPPRAKSEKPSGMSRPKIVLPPLIRNASA